MVVVAVVVRRGGGLPPILIHSTRPPPLTHLPCNGQVRDARACIPVPQRRQRRVAADRLVRPCVPCKRPRARAEWCRVRGVGSEHWEILTRTKIKSSPPILPLRTALGARCRSLCGPRWCVHLHSLACLSAASGRPSIFEITLEVSRVTYPSLPAPLSHRWLTA